MDGGEPTPRVSKWFLAIPFFMLIAGTLVVWIGYLSGDNDGVWGLFNSVTLAIFWACILALLGWRWMRRPRRS